MTGTADSSKTVHVVSGANRGLGFGVVEILAARANTIIYAGARDPSKADKLQQLAGKHSNVHNIKLRADSEDDHKAAAAVVEKDAGRADVVWANAGICDLDVWAPIEKTPLAGLREHFEVNTIHPLVLYQSFHTLLSRSASPKFFVSSSVSGSTASLDQLGAIPQTAYGVSKAAVNNITRRIHFENTAIVAVPFHPGWVQTEMGNKGAEKMGVKEAPMTTEESVNKIAQLFDSATRESHGGKYWSLDGDKELPW